LQRSVHQHTFEDLLALVRADECQHVLLLGHGVFQFALEKCFPFPSAKVTRMVGSSVLNFQAQSTFSFQASVRPPAFCVPSRFQPPMKSWTSRRAFLALSASALLILVSAAAAYPAAKAKPNARPTNDRSIVIPSV